MKTYYASQKKNHAAYLSPLIFSVTLYLHELLQFSHFFLKLASFLSFKSKDKEKSSHAINSRGMKIVHYVFSASRNLTPPKKEIENDQITVRSLLQRLEDAIPTKRATV